jgi:hypothetical protein
VEYERSFLRDAQRFSLLSAVFPGVSVWGVVGFCIRARFLSRQALGNDSAGAAWVRWGTFSVYGVKLHLLCATNRVPISYELTPANVADVSLTEELLEEAKLGEEVARRVLGDLAYRSEELREVLAEVGVPLATEPSERRRGVRQHIEIAFSSLKRVFGLGETLATTLVGLATRIAAKICAYTYALLVNRRTWIVLKVASRSCGPEILATLI